MVETLETAVEAYSYDALGWHSDLNTNFYATNAGNLPMGLPDFSGWGVTLTTPSALTIRVPDNPDDAPVIDLYLFEDALEELGLPLEYTGFPIDEAFDVDLAFDPEIFSRHFDLEIPPYLEGFDEMPNAVEEHFMMLAERPFSPLIGPPPRPEDFWYSLNFMHDQLTRFNVDDFLSDDVRRQVDNSLAAYEAFLDSIGGDISFLFQDNIFRMYDIHAEHNFFLQDLRNDAFAAHFNEQEALRATIGDFEYFILANSDDTQDRLHDFSVMMPVSRTPAGINQNLVDFAVAPFEFEQLALRDEPATAIFFEQFSADSMVETFDLYQRIAVWIMGGVFLVTLVYSLIYYLHKKNKAKDERLP